MLTTSPLCAGPHRAWLQPVGAALVGLLFLVGCTTVGPDYVPPVAPVADEWRSADEGRFPSTPADHKDWWKVFEDPILNELVELAYENNPTQLAAGAHILRARVLRSLSVIGNFPAILGASGSAARVDPSSNVETPIKIIDTGSGDVPLTITPDNSFSLYQVGFDAFWEIDLWGKKRRVVESVDAQLEAIVAEYDDILVSLTAEVAKQYVIYRTLQHRIRHAQENVGRQAASLELTLERFDDGDVTEVDIALARTLLLRTRTRIPELEAELAQAENAMAVLVGQPPQGLPLELSEPRPIPLAPLQIAVGIPADLLARRPDVRQAERELRAQVARIGVAEANKLPTFSLFGSLGLASTSTGNLFDGSSRQTSYGIAAGWNFLLWPALQDMVRAQDARFQEMVFDYEATVLRASREVENAAASLLKATQRLDLQDMGYASALESVEYATNDYANGEVDFTALRISLEDLSVEQDRLTQTQGVAALSAIALYKALGGGWQMRIGQDFLPEDVRDEMRARMEWERYLAPTDVPQAQDVPGDDRE